MDTHYNCIYCGRPLNSLTGIGQNICIQCESEETTEFERSIIQSTKESNMCEINPRCSGCGRKLNVANAYDNDLCNQCADEDNEPDIFDEDFEGEDLTDEECHDLENEYDDSMDGDHQSGLASAGFGTDEDYGYYGSDYDDVGFYESYGDE